MQFSKDSFYMALHDRLAVVNPLRTVTLDGATRPAIVVAENEPVGLTEARRDTFYLWWGNAVPAKGHSEGKRPLIALEASIFYHSAGTADDASDRGRTLTELDFELLQMCSPAFTLKQNFTATPSLSLGTNIVWSRPEFDALAPRDVEASRKRSVRCMHGGDRPLRTINRGWEREHSVHLGLRLAAGTLRSHGQGDGDGIGRDEEVSVGLTGAELAIETDAEGVGRGDGGLDGGGRVDCRRGRMGLRWRGCKRGEGKGGGDEEGGWGHWGSLARGFGWGSLRRVRGRGARFTPRAKMMKNSGPATLDRLPTLYFQSFLKTPNNAIDDAIHLSTPD